MSPVFLPESLQPLLRIALTAPALYLLVIVFIRLSGKRSTSQMNNFDWLVTVALGSIMASTLVLKDVTLAEGAFAIALLLLLQFLLTMLVRRFEWMSDAVKASPTMLFRNGEFVDEAMQRERISRKEILAAIRKAGMTDLSQVGWITLENDASFSIIAREKGGADLSGLAQIPNFDPQRDEIVARE